jgi:hypothetical protein
MPHIVPKYVPPAYKVEGSYEYGMTAVIECIRHSNECKRLAETYGDKLTRARDPKSDAAAYYKERHHHYKNAAVEWLACALNTAMNARKLLTQEQIERVRRRRERQQKPRDIRIVMP